LGFWLIFVHNHQKDCTGVVGDPGKAGQALVVGPKSLLKAPYCPSDLARAAGEGQNPVPSLVVSCFAGVFGAFEELVASAGESCLEEGSFEKHFQPVLAPSTLETADLASWRSYFGRLNHFDSRIFHVFVSPGDDQFAGSVAKITQTTKKMLPRSSQSADYVRFFDVDSHL